MTFSNRLVRPAAKASAGQAAIESLMGMAIVLVAALLGIILLLHGFLTLAATRWAEFNSQCVASKQDSQVCAQKIQKQMESYFVLHHVLVTSHVVRGVVHSEVSAKTIDGMDLKARYDLEAAEYKRVNP